MPIRTPGEAGDFVEFTQVVETIGRAVDLAGVLVIAVGIVWMTVLTVPKLRTRSTEEVYRSYRRSVGRAILLGLELLVAADIIRTVAVQPTFEGVAVLGLIVLVRTFLSFSLEMELSGRWPWQRGGEATPR